MSVAPLTQFGWEEVSRIGFTIQKKNMTVGTNQKTVNVKRLKELENLLSSVRALPKVVFDMSEFISFGDEHPDQKTRVCIAGIWALSETYVPFIEDGVTSVNLIIKRNSPNKKAQSISEYFKDAFNLSEDQANWLMYGEFAVRPDFTSARNNYEELLKSITIDEAIAAIRYLISNPESTPSKSSIILR